MDEYYTWDVCSVWHKHTPEFMYVGQWPLFHGPVILPYILKTICWTNAIFGILVPCDAKIYLIKYMWVSDLHLSRDMTKPTKWMCAQRRLRSAWASAQSDHDFLSARRKLGSLATHWVHSEDSDQTGQMPKLIWILAGRTLILLVLSCHGSFHGPVILCYILKTMWWINVVLEILILCGTNIELKLYM